MRTTAATAPDTGAHLMRLERDGFSVIRGFMPLDFAGRLRAHLDALLGPVQETTQGLVRDLRHPIPGDILAEALYHEPLLRLAMEELAIDDPADLRLLEQVLIRTERATGAGGPVAWHIDAVILADEAAARPRRTYHHHVQALGDVAPGGGALMLVPGSHRLTRAATVGADAATLARLKADPVAVAGVDLSAAIEVTARAGDLIVFDPMCVHSGSRNRSATPRHVLFTSFLDRSATRLIGELRGTGYLRELPPALRRQRPEALRDLLLEP